MTRILVAALVFSTLLPVAASADDPKTIAKDFCNAVAAQALCRKVFVMPKDTEARMEALAGGKLRGDGWPLKDVCNEGYNEFYDLEGSDGLQMACQTTLGLFGPNGSRRAGLVTPVAAPAMKMAESDIAAIAQDLCYAATVAEACPDISLTEGVEQRLNTETGVELRKKGGYFSSECGGGVFSASLAKGKAPIARFCAASLAAYGPQGTTRTGLLAGSGASKTTGSALSKAVEAAQSVAETLGVNKKAAPEPANTAPVETVAVKPVAAKTPAPETMVVLTELPPLKAGKSAEDMLGAVPGTLSDAECATLDQQMQASKQRLDAATNLAELAELAITHAADIRLVAALCPGRSVPAPPDAAVARVTATGLEACHIVLDADKALQDRAGDQRKQKRYRGMMAIDDARLWAIEAFSPSCSKLTARTIESRLKFAKQQVERNRESYPCRIWQDFQRAEMDKVRALGKEKDFKQAIDVLDNRVAAAIHGMGAACADEKYMESSKNYWLSQRQYLQQRMSR